MAWEVRRGGVTGQVLMRSADIDGAQSALGS